MTSNEKGLGRSGFFHDRGSWPAAAVARLKCPESIVKCAARALMSETSEMSGADNIMSDRQGATVHTVHTVQKGRFAEGTLGAYRPSYRPKTGLYRPKFCATDYRPWGKEG